MLPMGQQMDQRKQALMKKMQGMVDSRGMLGQFSRGNNVYSGGLPNAQAGGGAQFGPPQGNQNAMQPGGLPQQAAPQADANMMLKRQMDQAKSALQMANMKRQGQTQEQSLKNAMERRMGQQGQAASGNPKAGGLNSLLKRKKDVQSAATRVRNAYTVG